MGDHNSVSSHESFVSVSNHESFIGSIDQGTTSTRFLIFNKDGEPVASHQVEFSQIYPESGLLTMKRWHEHDPLEIIDSIEVCIECAVNQFEKQGHSARQIKAVGLTNQRETTVVWDHETGEPLANAIVWTDTRNQALIRKLKARLGSNQLQGLCGLPLSIYPSVAGVCTIDSWVIYKLNGGPKKNVFVTDPTNASRSMFMNLHTLKYDEQLLDFFRFDMDKLHLPKIVRSSDRESFGDQSAALVGQKGFTPGRAKNTYGTGCFLLYHVGDKPVISTHGLLSTVAYDFDGKPQYALEGSIAVAGSSIKFLQNNLGFIDSSAKISQLAETVEDNGGVTFVTAFSGLFAPYWYDDARGTLFGITAYTQKGHIARATLEATCFQTKAILNAMEKDSGKKLAELAVDGGMCNSDLCMQTQADLISIPVERPRMLETTALGAAIAAGFAVGVWETFDELKNINTVGKTEFHPKITPEESKEKFSRWTKAVEMCKGWL
ncbi:glycerol kinase [Botrytis cinerea]